MVGRGRCRAVRARAGAEVAVGHCSGGRCSDGAAAALRRRCGGAEGAEAELATPRPNLATALTLAKAVRRRRGGAAHLD